MAPRGVIFNFGFPGVTSRPDRSRSFIPVNRDVRLLTLGFTPGNRELKMGVPARFPGNRNVRPLTLGFTPGNRELKMGVPARFPGNRGLATLLRAATL
jgi:hypothetical protein